MTLQTREDAVATAGRPVRLLRNAAGPPDPGPLTGAEISNWRDERHVQTESRAVVAAVPYSAVPFS